MHSSPPSVLLIPANADDAAALDGTLASARSAAWLNHAAAIILPFGHNSQSPSALAALADLAGRHFPNARVRGMQGFDDAILATADVVLVAAGCLLPDGWDIRLQKAATAFPRIGAVSALDQHDLSLQPASSVEAMRFDPATADAAIYALGDRAVYDSPTISSACAYLRGGALREVAAQARTSVLNLLLDFPALHARLTFSGWQVCTADFCVVSAGPNESPAARHPDPEALRIFAALNPQSQLKLRVVDFMKQSPAQLPKPGLDDRPVLLHVLHSWGGGVEKWVRDFCAGDPSHIHLLLTSVQVGSDGTQRMRLAFPHAPQSAVREWDLSMPIRSISPGSLEYERNLQEVIRDFSVDAIVVSSLIGHSLTVLEQDVRTLWICHDYLPLCQSIFPFFGGPCERCNVDDLGRCQRENPLNVEFRAVAPDHWHALRRRFVDILFERRPKIVVPSFSVIEGMKKLESRIGELNIDVIPHGIDSPAAALPATSREPGEKLRLVLLGRMNALKGEQILRELVPMLGDEFEITLVGCGPRGVEIADELGLRAIPAYRVEELEDLLRSLAPHAGLLLSTFPETFSYTLSELQVLGIPPIATRLGAFVERIEHGKTGLLFDPYATDLRRLLGELLDKPEILIEVGSHLRASKQRRSIADMVAGYQSLLPSGPLEQARFKVGRGEKTAILADYAHLAAAYRSLHEAYGQVQLAYQDTNKAYLAANEAYQAARLAFDSAQEREQANAAELARVTALVGQLASDAGKLRLSWQWWHAPEAAQLICALADNVTKIADVPTDQGSGTDT